jgi:hypothetical protein
MKKNRLNILSALILLIGFSLACNSFSGGASNENPAFDGNKNSANADADNTPVKATAECPTATLSVNDAKNNGLKKYEGCTVSLRGKLWDIQSTTAEIFDANDRTNYNGSVFVGGNFSGSKFSDVGLKLSKMKIDQKYDQLPVVTFTGTVKTVSGYIGLKDSLLSDVQK